MSTDALHGDEDPVAWKETRLEALYKKKGDVRLVVNYSLVAVSPRLWDRLNKEQSRQTWPHGGLQLR